ncbi:sensor histidine kinase [Agrobacterium sp. BA1120]|uniref:sensor histidine kinase n=1 Tax=Agrobacterium sp. BA1120 TaxID=3228927 RepID=UPI00336A487E
MIYPVLQLIKVYLRTIYIVAGSIFLSSVYAHASETLGVPALDGHIFMFAEEGGEYNLSDILLPQYQARFQPVTGKSINPGYTRKAYWIKLALPASQNGPGVLSLSPNFLDFVDVYVQRGGNADDARQFNHYEFGDHRPLPVDGISGISPAVRLDFSSGQTSTVYIRLSNTGSFTQLHLRLEPRESVPLRRVTDGLTFGVWFGAMAALFLTQLVFFHFDRKVRHLLLAASTLGVILVYVGNLGLSRIFLFPDDGVANDVFIGVTAWGGFSASALAYASILSLWRRSRKLYALYCLFALAGLVGVCFAIAGKNIVSGPYISLIAIIAGFTAMIVGWRQARVDGQAGKLAAVAFTLVAIGGSVAMVQRLGIPWMPEWVFNLYGLSALCQTLLLTGAKALRLRDAEALNSSLKAEALNEAQRSETRAIRLVEERTRELVEARKVAEEALNAETESQLRQVRFLEVISHQYRTPLASIRSNIDAVELSMPEDDHPNRRRIMRVRNTISRLTEVLELNVTRSQIQGPSFRVDMRRVRIGEILDGALQRAGDLLTEPHISYRAKDNADMLSVKADPQMLELAIVNLLENAVKYSSPQDTQHIVLSVEKAGGELVIGVEDRGLGIPADDLPHIFENARRGANTQNLEGTGLGLFLVEKVASVHQGRVDAQSIEGEGTLIRIILPIDLA